MKLKERQKALLACSQEENWFGVYDILRESEDLVDFSNLVDHPEIEEALMRCLAEDVDDLTRMIISRDREIVTRYPDLRSLEAVKNLPDHHIEAWRFSAALRVLIGIHDHIDQAVQVDPHRDHSDLLLRAARFPISEEEFKLIIGSCLAKILHYSSLMGLELTLGALKGHSEKMFCDAATILIWYPDYHDRAEYLWDQRLISHQLLQQMVPVARKLGFPRESIDWIREHLATPEPEDPDMPF